MVILAASSRFSLQERQASAFVRDAGNPGLSYSTFRYLFLSNGFCSPTGLFRSFLVVLSERSVGFCSSGEPTFSGVSSRNMVKGGNEEAKFLCIDRPHLSLLQNVASVTPAFPPRSPSLVTGFLRVFEDLCTRKDVHVRAHSWQVTAWKDSFDHADGRSCSRISNSWWRRCNFGGPEEIRTLVQKRLVICVCRSWGSWVAFVLHYCSRAVGSWCSKLRLESPILLHSELLVWLVGHFQSPGTRCRRSVDCRGLRKIGRLR